MCDKLICTLENYIINYYENVNTINAQQIISNFDENWKEIIISVYADTFKWLCENKSINKIPIGFSKYGLALILFSKAYSELPTENNDDIIRLSILIEEFENNDINKNEFAIKSILYNNLGVCWHKLGEHDNKAIEAFKKYIYYEITLSSYNSYLTDAYAFRKCNTFLYQSLINEQLNLSSPTTFNDPFDCPIVELLNNGNEISSLVRNAYKDCLKIACFTKNTKLPYAKDPKNDWGKFVSDDKKHDNDPDEFLNSLMWAHYADSHRGICIKYCFFHPISKLRGEDKNIVAYFKDVRYSQNDLSQYSKLGKIKTSDAFFLKGKEWEYENELRFLYYNSNDHSEHRTIDIPNCIEAIYFGLKCSEKDKETIMNIMKDKKLVIKDPHGNIIGEDSIKFYQMEIDKEHFGQLKAVKIN